MELFCPDSQPVFLGLFDPSIAPPLLFYSYIPTIVLSLVIGSYIMYKDRFSLLSRLLFGIAASFAAWVLIIFTLWIAVYNSHIMLGWQLNPLSEILIFLFSIYFVYVFIDPERKDISNNLKFVLLLIFVPFAFLLPTSHNILNYDINSCEGVLGPLWDFMYVFEIASVFWIVGICLRKYRELNSNPQMRLHQHKIIYVMMGMGAFLTLFISSNILGEALEIQEISFLGALGMMLFLGFLAYLIVKYQSFNARIIGANALVIALWILTASLLFINDIAILHLVVSITLAMTTIFGYALGKSVQREVAQREEIEQLAVRLKAANEGLAVANSKLKELDKQKTEFLSIASHQLRSPLTAIKGYASMILEGSFGPVEEKARGAVDVIFQSAQKLVLVIEDFLNVTRIELGRMKFDKTDVDLKQLVDTVVCELKPMAESHGLELAFSTARGNKYFSHVDAGKISQVVTNVIDNAIKYTEQGSIKVRLEQAEGKNLIKVTDTGVGMDAETMTRLFQKFSRAYNASKTNANGTGLGLFVARQLVENHGGQLSATSPGPGQGSTFTIELPAIPQVNS